MGTLFYLLLVVTGKKKDVGMSTETALPLTQTISLISCGKFVFDLQVFVYAPILRSSATNKLKFVTFTSSKYCTRLQPA
jgi:hypothetical protein